MTMTTTTTRGCGARRAHRAHRGHRAACASSTHRHRRRYPTTRTTTTMATMALATMTTGDEGRRGATTRAVVRENDDDDDDAVTTDGDASSSPSPSPSPSPSSPSSSFDWFQAWYPMRPVSFLDAEAPNEMKVLGKKLVAWLDTTTNEWRVLEDSCPHRRAPLSLGYVQKDGTLACRFTGGRLKASAGRVRRYR